MNVPHYSYQDWIAQTAIIPDTVDKSIFVNQWNSRFSKFGSPSSAWSDFAKFIRGKVGMFRIFASRKEHEWTKRKKVSLLNLVNEIQTGYNVLYNTEPYRSAIVPEYAKQIHDANQKIIGYLSKISSISTFQNPLDIIGQAPELPRQFWETDDVQKRSVAQTPPEKKEGIKTGTLITAGIAGVVAFMALK